MVGKERKKKEIEERKKDGGMKEEKGRVGKGGKEGWKKREKRLRERKRAGEQEGEWRGRKTGRKKDRFNQATTYSILTPGQAILGQRSEDKICQGKEAWLWSHKNASLNPDLVICLLCDANMSLSVSEPVCSAIK